MESIRQSCNGSALSGIRQVWLVLILMAIQHSRRCQAFTLPSFPVPNAILRPIPQNFGSLRRNAKTSSLGCQKCHTSSDLRNPKKFMPRIRRLFRRFDTIQAARESDLRIRNDGAANDTPVLMAGSGGLFGTIKKLHNPIVYFVLGVLAGFRYDWCFKSPIYWFAIGFTIKWYRARYVFKIPVWDRQPNWNNIITSKEQEKDLKAFTCKNCGSTIFIAKTREFFFEGSTGFGGLGCFSCGAKGKDNFVMDRERIVEDVGDMDDYFEYERPLDFVSRAERRKLLKEAQGDEDRANQLLLERTTGISSSTTATPSDTAVEAVDAILVNTEEITEPADVSDDAPPAVAPSNQFIESDSIDSLQSNEDVVSLNEEDLPRGDLVVTQKDDPQADNVLDDSGPVSDALSSNDKARMGQTVGSDPVAEVSIQSAAEPPKIETPKKVASKSKSNASSGLDGLDELDMDAW